MTTEQKKVAKRLQEYSDAMKPVYVEIEKKVHEIDFPQGRYQVLADIVNSAIMCGKKGEIRKGINGLDDLERLNRKIFEEGENLINLLNARDSLLKDSYVTSKTKIDPVGLIRKAGMTMRPTPRRLFFKREVISIFGDIDNPVLNTATVNGNMPTIQEVLASLITEISTTPIEGRSRTIKKLLEYRKATPADFVRVFLYNLNISALVGYLPYDFSLTPKTVAITTGCALDIDGGVTEGSVKKAAKRTPCKRI
jgi:hypothetical protein